MALFNSIYSKVFVLNVYLFFCSNRVFSSVSKKNIFNTLAEELVSKKEPALYNQAIMDFGATVCKPISPVCGGCVLWSQCFAFNSGTVGALPFKVQKPQKQRRWFNYIIFDDGTNVLMRMRETQDIWQNLHEFFLIETSSAVSVSELLVNEDVGEIAFASGIYKQVLSHQIINGQFVHCRVPTLPLKSGYHAYPKDELKLLAFPKFIRNFLANNMI